MEAKAAMIIIGFLTGWALWLGYDTAILSLAVAVIAGLAGYKVGKKKA